MDGKRTLDVVLATTALVMTSPLLALSAVAVKLDSRGPAIYRGVRVGRNAREFHIFKLRTMKVDADRVGPPITVADDGRITCVGRVLRRTKLDELPQLWNVVVGDMSLVGPRPEHPDFVRQYTPEQMEVLSVRPGVTGPAAMQFADEGQLLKGDAQSAYLTVVMPQKLRLDLDYVRDHSVAGDLRILLRTGLFVIRRTLRLA